MGMSFDLDDALEYAAEAFTRNADNFFKSIVDRNNAQAEYYRARTEQVRNETRAGML